jgi:hypothetical protein
MPVIAERFFLGYNARVQIFPVNAGDLAAAQEGIERAVVAHGGRSPPM